jgi:mono/diheme cytochrome c family protein
MRYGMVDFPLLERGVLDMKQMALWVLAAFLLMPVGPAAAADDGAAIYKKNCAGCHDSIRTSFKGGSVAALTRSVISGSGGKMKPRAGTKLTDAEIRAAVEYLVSK